MTLQRSKCVFLDSSYNASKKFWLGSKVSSYASC